MQHWLHNTYKKTLKLNITEKQIDKYTFKVLNNDIGALTINNVLVSLMLFANLLQKVNKKFNHWNEYLKHPNPMDLKFSHPIINSVKYLEAIHTLTMTMFSIQICHIFRKCLTHYCQGLLPYTIWKHQKTLRFRFSDVFKGYRKATLGCNGLSYFSLLNLLLTFQYQLWWSPFQIQLGKTELAISKCSAILVKLNFKVRQKRYHFLYKVVCC